MLRASAFWVAKAGNTSEEYEDAFAINIETGRFAIADGATESSFAKQWAELLATEFVTNSFSLRRLRKKKRGKSWENRLSKWLAPLERTWYESIDWNELSWFAEEKARNGAFATFLGLEFKKPMSSSTLAQWFAIAIGDCILFHVRNDKLNTAFPLSRADEFGSNPALLGSNSFQNRAIWEKLNIKQGSWRASDFFFLCTDALAQWFLNQCEAGAKPWLVLSDISEQEKFEELVRQLRADQLVRNDDMTLLSIGVE